MADRRAILVIDLAYGDCGKGTVVDYLVRRAVDRGVSPLVIRFNGGPQAGHNVVTADGRHHTFSQFGSGTFVPGVRTLLSRFMLIEPYALFNEADHLASLGEGDAMKRLLIDAQCLVITPAHQAANRIRETARGASAHGTCGAGVGEAMADWIANPDLAIHAGELSDRSAVARQLRAVRDLKLATLRAELDAVRSHPAAWLAVETLLDDAWVPVAVDAYAELARAATVVDPSGAEELVRASPRLVFEGAQGVLLDEWFGFHPYTTWSTTTFANAETILQSSGFSERPERVGVLRTYLTRHGAGPLVTADDAVQRSMAEPHNGDAGWQGTFRAGSFDAVAARYALAVAGGVDSLAVTHLDRLPLLPPRICVGYASAAEARDDALFHRSGDNIVDIVKGRVEDLPRQSRLAEALAACRPVYASAPTTDRRSFLQLLERELSASVGLTSHGPTAGDKQLSDAAMFG